MSNNNQINVEHSEHSNNGISQDDALNYIKQNIDNITIDALQGKSKFHYINNGAIIRSENYKLDQFDIVIQKVDHNFINGKLFEDFIYSLFKENNYMSLHFRTSDTMYSYYGIYDRPKSDSYPDFVFNCTQIYNKGYFALECKYRKYFQNYSKGVKIKNNKICYDDNNFEIEICTEDKIENYVNFFKLFKIPVHIALGIGSNPSNPDYLFIFPLSKLNEKSTIKIKELKEYEIRNWSVNTTFYMNENKVLRPVDGNKNEKFNNQD